MTQERAIYVLGNSVKIAGQFAGFYYTNDAPEAPHPHRRPRRDDGITAAEDAYVNMIWGLMGENASYYDAVLQVVKGM